MTPLLAQRQRADRSFERLYRRHVGDVYRYALAVMRNQPDAEDVTQTTFMNALRAFQRGERPEKPQNWLIAIAHNVCRQRFRQSARRPTEVAFDDDVGAQFVDTDDVAPSGEDIRRALGHLAFNQRAALVMRELEGRSYAEIGEILELSPSAVETLIFRARRALREQLETSLTCGEAELAISRQLDGRLTRAEKGALRAHLRECKECAGFARRQRAQRTAIRSLAAVPVPTSLTSLFGGGGGGAAIGGIGGGLVLKGAAAFSAAAVVGGAGYAGVHQAVRHHTKTAKTPTTGIATPTLKLGAATSPMHRPVVSPKGAHLSRLAAGAGATAHRPTRAHGHNHATAVSHGDASVASRHLNQPRTHPAHPSHPATSAGAHSAAAPGRTKVHAHAAANPSKPAKPPKSAPGPYEAGPPSGSGNGGGNGNGKGGGK